MSALTANEPALSPKSWQETATWMAPPAKFFAVYDRPFWRKAGLSGTAQSFVGPLGEIHDATTASGKAALFGFPSIGADARVSWRSGICKSLPRAICAPLWSGSIAPSCHTAQRLGGRSPYRDRGRPYCRRSSDLFCSTMGHGRLATAAFARRK